jgi:hypothetical protein
MSAIKKLPMTRFDCVVLANDLQKALSAWKSNGRDISFPVESVIYGAAHVRDQAGRILSDATVYLQEPRHCIARPMTTRMRLSSLSAPKSTVTMNFTQSPKAQVSGEAIQDVLNDLNHLDVTHKMVNVSNRLCLTIKTPLLSHQLVGVNFIAQKEGRQPSSSMDSCRG